MGVLGGQERGNKFVAGRSPEARSDQGRQSRYRWSSASYHPPAARAPALAAGAGPVGDSPARTAPAKSDNSLEYGATRHHQEAIQHIQHSSWDPMQLMSGRQRQYESEPS